MPQNDSTNNFSSKHVMSTKLKHIGKGYGLLCIYSSNLIRIVPNFYGNIK